MAESFASRLQAIAPNRGDMPRLSEKTGINVRTITRWAKGQGEPQVTELILIAQAAGVRLEWLATGKEPMREGEASSPLPQAGPESMAASLDHDFAGIVSEAVLNLYREENARLPTARILAIGFEKYEEIMSASTDPAERSAMLKLVLQQLRKDLRTGTKATTHGKRSA